MAAAAERRDVSSGCCQLERGVRQPAPAESSQVPAVWMVEVTTPVPPIHGQPLTDAAVHCTAWPPPPQLRSGPPPHPPPHPPLAARRRLERVPLRYCAPGGPGRTRGATRRWGAGGGGCGISTPFLSPSCCPASPSAHKTQRGSRWRRLTAVGRHGGTPSKQSNIHTSTRTRQHERRVDQAEDAMRGTPSGYRAGGGCPPLAVGVPQ